MSRMEHYKGKLEYVNKLPNETLEEQCKRVMEEDGRNIDLSWWRYDTVEELMRGEYHYEYIIYNDNIFRVTTCNEIIGSESIYVINNNNDGTYNYEVMYYNGGESFSEAIEEGFKILDKSIDK